MRERFERLEGLETHKDNFPEKSVQVCVFDPGFWEKMLSQWLFWYFPSQQMSWAFEWLIWWGQKILKGFVSTENMSAPQ